jgi:hypothetical protein
MIYAGYRAWTHGAQNYEILGCNVRAPHVLPFLDNELLYIRVK